MSRLALACEYDGTNFVGWQAQLNGRSVQTELTAAVSKVAAESVQVHGAGRTDAGVHAAAQIAHFDCAVKRTQRQWLLGINSNLPDDIAVHWVQEVPQHFDARRSAIWREYRYVIANQPVRPACDRLSVWWVHQVLDCAAMTAAASAWLGEQDFSAFRAAHCQSTSPMRNMLNISIARTQDRIVLGFRANAFVYHMVRNMVGALVAIGRGEYEPEFARELLAGRNRSLGPQTAPARGLTLHRVAYPLEFELPTVQD